MLRLFCLLKRYSIFLYIERKEGKITVLCYDIFNGNFPLKLVKNPSSLEAPKSTNHLGNWHSYVQSSF